MMETILSILAVILMISGTALCITTMITRIKYDKLLNAMTAKYAKSFDEMMDLSMKMMKIADVSLEEQTFEEV